MTAARAIVHELTFPDSPVRRYCVLAVLAEAAGDEGSYALESAYRKRLAAMRGALSLSDTYQARWVLQAVRRSGCLL